LDVGATIVMLKYGAAAAVTVAIGMEDETKTKAITPSIAPLAISFEYQERIYFRSSKGFGLYNHIYLEAATRSANFSILGPMVATKHSLTGN
jgi:hypothetical protein